jgi:hypothetical protein
MRLFKTIAETIRRNHKHVRKQILILFALAPAAASAAESLIYNGHASENTKVFHAGPWQANLVPLVILIIGLGHLLYPRVAWWFKWGWRFQDPPEPSTLWLFGERLGGAVTIIVAVILFGVINGVQIPLPK